MKRSMLIGSLFACFLMLMIPNISAIEFQTNLKNRSYIDNLVPKTMINGYQDDVIADLDEITHSLDKPPLLLSNEDLESLSYLSNCKIVGLGEATHGTKEFFQLKHRIFQYLVESYDYKVFAFECDMGESYYINNYLTKGEGDLDYIMKNIMHFWTWSTEEVKELLIWMRSYNKGQADQDQIHLIGVDCQFLTYQAEIVLDYVERCNISLSNESFHFLQEIDWINQSVYDFYEDMTLEEKEQIDKQVDQVLQELEELKDVLVLSSSPFEYQFVYRIADNIKQVNDQYFGVRSRDYIMAQNTLWARQIFGEDTKIAVWAHNMHLINADNYFSNGSMGFHLKEALDDDYQIIHFGFSYGRFTAISLRFFFGMDCIIRMPPLLQSLNYVCHNARDTNFILREQDIVENSSLNTWISETNTFLDIGALFTFCSYLYYHAYRFKEHSDILIYWDTTTASNLLT